MSVDLPPTNKRKRLSSMFLRKFRRRHVQRIKMKRPSKLSIARALAITVTSMCLYYTQVIEWLTAFPDLLDEGGAYLVNLDEMGISGNFNI